MQEARMCHVVIEESWRGQQEIKSDINMIMCMLIRYRLLQMEIFVDVYIQTH